MRSLKRDLLWAIPAVLAFGAAVTLFFLGHDSKQISERYLVRGRTAQANEAYAWALLCFRKAELLGTGDTQVTYDKAICQSKTRPKDAIKTMQSIADAPERFPMARVWLAREKLQRGRLTREELKVMEADLDDIVLQAGKNPKAQLGKLHAMQLGVMVKIQTKGPEAAVTYLRELAAHSVVERLRLARVCEITGRAAEASDNATSVLNSSVNAVRTRPEDTDARLLAVDACYVLKDFRRAVMLLGEGIRNQGQDPRLMTALSTTYLVWAEEENKAPQPKLENVLELLLLATRFAPVNRFVFDRLAAFARKKGEMSETARKALISCLARGQSPSLVHLMLGTLAFDPKNLEQTERHWQLAADVDPKSYINMSNLALGLVSIEEKAIAMALIDKALKLGQEPQMHDTRSRVLASLERYPEAMAELEKAMAGLPDNWALRMQAAELSRRLKKPEDANRYDVEAERIRAAAAKKGAETAPEETDKTKAAAPPIVPGEATSISPKGKGA